MRYLNHSVRLGSARLLSTAMTSLVLVVCGPGVQRATAQPAPSRPTDANIVYILSTANNGEIEAGQLALEKSENERVREFAQRMIADHEWANEQSRELMQNINVSPAATETGRELETSTRETLESLRGMSGRAFDREYIQSQIAMHEWLLQTLDQSLIPGARNEELERWLLQLRPTIAEHLQMAQQIQGALDRR